MAQPSAPMGTFAMQASVCEPPTNGSSSSSSSATTSLDWATQLLSTKPVAGTQLSPALSNLFVRSAASFARRWFIVDNSGSMASQDGAIFVSGRKVRCSRWQELQQSIAFHGEVASRLGAPTEFRLLNRPPGAPQCVCVGDASPPAGAVVGVAALQRAMDTSPMGGTPLCRHLRRVAADLAAMRVQLNQTGQRAVVVIATDGESSDGDLRDALRPFESLPCVVVVRLCTDDERIVQYWDAVDNDLELELDVLDDLAGEAAEVNTHNPWLTYSPQMHRLREWGAPDKVFDRLDEDCLAPSELRRLCMLLLGGADDAALPDAALDPERFTAAVKELVPSEPKVADPRGGGSLAPPVDIALVARVARGERVKGQAAAGLLQSKAGGNVAMIAAVVMLLVMLVFWS